MKIHHKYRIASCTLSLLAALFAVVAVATLHYIFTRDDLNFKLEYGLFKYCWDDYNIIIRNSTLSSSVSGGCKGPGFGDVISIIILIIVALLSLACVSMAFLEEFNFSQGDMGTSLGRYVPMVVATSTAFVVASIIRYWYAYINHKLDVDSVTKKPGIGMYFLMFNLVITGVNCYVSSETRRKVQDYCMEKEGNDNTTNNYTEDNVSQISDFEDEKKFAL
eukprot:Pgem_evm2s18532